MRSAELGQEKPSEDCHCTLAQPQKAQLMHNEKKKKNLLCFIQTELFFSLELLSSALGQKEGMDANKIGQRCRASELCVLFFFLFFVTFEPFSTMKPFLLLCLFVTAALAQGSNGGYPGE